jgi:transposase InsO family protein
MSEPTPRETVNDEAGPQTDNPASQEEAVAIPPRAQEALGTDRPPIPAASAPVSAFIDAAGRTWRVDQSVATDSAVAARSSSLGSNPMPPPAPRGTSQNQVLAGRENPPAQRSQSGPSSQTSSAVPAIQFPPAIINPGSISSSQPSSQPETPTGGLQFGNLSLTPSRHQVTGRYVPPKGNKQAPQVDFGLEGMMEIPGTPRDRGGRRERQSSCIEEAFDQKPAAEGEAIHILASQIHPFIDALRGIPDSGDESESAREPWDPAQFAESPYDHYDMDPNFPLGENQRIHDEFGMARLTSEKRKALGRLRLFRQETPVWPDGVEFNEEEDMPVLQESICMNFAIGMEFLLVDAKALEVYEVIPPELMEELHEWYAKFNEHWEGRGFWRVFEALHNWKTNGETEAELYHRLFADRRVLKPHFLEETCSRRFTMDQYTNCYNDEPEEKQPMTERDYLMRVVGKGKPRAPVPRGTGRQPIPGRGVEPSGGGPGEAPRAEETNRPARTAFVQSTSDLVICSDFTTSECKAVFKRMRADEIAEQLQEREKYFHESAWTVLERRMESVDNLWTKEEKEQKAWRTCSITVFIDKINSVFAMNSEATLDVVRKLSEKKFSVAGFKTNGWNVFQGEVARLLPEFQKFCEAKKYSPEQVEGIRKQVLTAWVKMLKDSKNYEDKLLVMAFEKRPISDRNTFNTFLNVMDQAFVEVTKVQVASKEIEEVRKSMGKDGNSSQKSSNSAGNKGNGSSSGSNKFPQKRKNESGDSDTHNPPKDPKKQKVTCCKCGKGHKDGDCLLGDHPDLNRKAGVKFLDSDIGKRYKEIHRYEINPMKGINRTTWKELLPLPQALQDKIRDKLASRKQGEELVSTNNSIPITNNFLLDSFIIAKDKTEKAVQTLVDTGALGTDLISRETADFLLAHGGTLRSCQIHVSFPCNNSQKINCSHFVSLGFKFKSDISCNWESFQVRALVHEDLKLDAIVARPTYLTHNLHDKLRSHLTLREGETTYRGPVYQELLAALSTEIAPATLKSVTDWFGDKGIEDYEFPPTDSSIYELPTRSGRTEGSYRFEQEELNLIEFGGSVEFQNNMKKLVIKYKTIFSKVLNKEPADIKPLVLKVDESKWKVARTKAGPRLLSPVKVAELHKQIDEFVGAGIIQPSQQPHHSQVLLVSKPDGSWRFCIDYRYLNACLEKMGWPIPNIEEICARIAMAKPTIFGKGDFTKGYYQGMMHPDSTWLTAFITPFGTYEWSRIAMGLATAPSWYQQQIATEVLAGLVPQIVEHYIDDLLLYARTEEEFLMKMETLFKRLQEKRITLNPSKCCFGVPEVNFLGYLFNGEGRRMMKSQIDKILQYPRPRLAGQLKSFLGMANYFHSFISNLAILRAPLEAMLKGYTKKVSKKVLTWGNEEEKAFRELRDAINATPQLYNIDEGIKLILQTDASNFGIGAVLYQMKEVGSGKEKEARKFPVGFFSKTLTDHALNWGPNEKEAFAIVAAVKHWSHLLSGRKFLVQTDHKNLQYISETCSPKVIRWKLALQEFNFDTFYLKGEDNVVADFLSRIPPEEEILQKLEEAKNSQETFVCSFIEEDVRDDEANFRVDTTEDYQEMLSALLEDFQPDAEQETIIRTVHNSTGAGHLGVNPTVKRLQDLGHNWPHLRLHVRALIKRCPICQMLDREQPDISTTPFTLSSRSPMEVLHMDWIGPLHFENNETGYILVIIDCFTRWVELYPAATIEAVTTAECLHDFIGRYGTPKMIVSDRGVDFTSSLVEELIRLSGIEHHRSLRHSKQEVAIVERANQEVMRHLRALFLDGRIPEAYKTDLPTVQRIMNSATHSSIGTSPQMLMFGGQLDITREIFQEDTWPAEITPNMPPNYKVWLDKRLERQKVLLELAEQHQVRIDVTNLAKRDPGELTHFPVGSYVLAQWPDGLGGRKPPYKWMAAWEGPLQVVEANTPVYVLRNLITGDLKQYHIQTLKPFNIGPRDGNPRDFALKVAHEVEVESVIDHRNLVPSPDRITNYQFKVKWNNRDERFNEWLDWSSVRTNTVVHEYMRTHGLGNKIPAEFR